MSLGSSRCGADGLRSSDSNSEFPRDREDMSMSVPAPRRSRNCAVYPSRSSMEAAAAGSTRLGPDGSTSSNKDAAWPFRALSLTRAVSSLLARLRSGLGTLSCASLSCAGLECCECCERCELRIISESSSETLAKVDTACFLAGRTEGLRGGSGFEAAAPSSFCPGIDIKMGTSEGADGATSRGSFKNGGVLFRGEPKAFSSKSRERSSSRMML